MRQITSFLPCLEHTTMMIGMNVLVIGSSVIDLFTRTADTSHIQLAETSVTLQLGDKIPIEIDNLTIGGNGANVSVGLKRLGIPTVFYTYLGNDILSSKIETALSEEGVVLLAERGNVENTSLSIILHFESDRIIFSHHQLRDHGFSYHLENLPDMVYLTAMGKEWEQAYKKILTFVKDTSVPLAFSPGATQLTSMNDVVKEAVCISKLLFVNKQEAEIILKAFNKKASSIQQMLRELSVLGPSVVSLTDGGEGSYALSSDTMLQLGTFPIEKAVAEKTGAGDSYAAAFLAGYLTTQPLEQAMRMGAANANAVMQHIGAQVGLLNIKDLTQKLTSHKEFLAKILS